jgi:hypothetical protein
MNDSFLLQWLGAFASTIIVESPIYALFARPFASVPMALLMSLAVQMTTHPLLWLNFDRLDAAIGSYPLTLAVCEVTIVIVESLLLGWMWGHRWRLAAVAALVANSASVAVGLLR